MIFLEAQEIRAQVHQELQTVRQRVKLRQDARPGRNHRLAEIHFEFPFVRRADRLRIRRVRVGRRLRVGSELLCQQIQKLELSVRFEPPVGLAQSCGARARGNLSAGFSCAIPQLLANLPKLSTQLRLRGRRRGRLRRLRPPKRRHAIQPAREKVSVHEAHPAGRALPERPPLEPQSIIVRRKCELFEGYVSVSGVVWIVPHPVAICTDAHHARSDSVPRPARGLQF